MKVSELKICGKMETGDTERPMDLTGLSSRLYRYNYANYICMSYQTFVLALQFLFLSILMYLSATSM
jgi:hypothetical protein